MLSVQLDMSYGAETELPLSDVAAGVYFLTFTGTDGRVMTERVVKQ